MFNSKFYRCDQCLPPPILRKPHQECPQAWKNRFCTLRKQWSEHSKCGSNNLEDCADCRCPTIDSERVVGKFGIAWVAEIPGCESEEPKGWQIEIVDNPEGILRKCRQLIKWLNNPPKIYDSIEGNNFIPITLESKQVSVRPHREYYDNSFRNENYNLENDMNENLDACTDVSRNRFVSRGYQDFGKCINCNKTIEEDDSYSQNCPLESCKENAEDRNKRNHREHKDKNFSKSCKCSVKTELADYSRSKKCKNRICGKRSQNYCSDCEPKVTNGKSKENILDTNSETCVDFNHNPNECKFRKNKQRKKSCFANNDCKSTDESSCDENKGCKLESCFPRRPDKCQFSSHLPEDGDLFKKENCCCHCQDKFYRNTGTMCDTDSVPHKENDINELDSKVICAGIRSEALCKKMMDKKKNQIIEEQEKELENTIIATDVNDIKNEDGKTANNPENISRSVVTSSMNTIMSPIGQRRSSKFRRKESM